MRALMRRLLAVLTLSSPILVAMSCGTEPPPESKVATTTPASTSMASTASTGAPKNAPSTSVSASASVESKPTGVDESAMNKTAEPCDDFYEYACGGWIKNTPIPGDRPSWSRSFSEIDDRNEKALDAVLERDASGKGDLKDAYMRKLGDFYGACMDEAAIEKASVAPLQEPFEAIDRITGKAMVGTTIRDLYKMGFTPLFAFSSGQDFADATQVIGQLEQAGLGLPDRDYYLKTDSKSLDIRKQYEEHVAKMLQLAKVGGPAEAKIIVAFETELAKSSMTRTDRRDPKKIYHRMQLDGLQKLATSFGFDSFLDGLAVAKTAPINVQQPDFVKALEVRLAKATPSEWKAYLKWHVVKEAARTLPKAFVDEDFHFKSTALTGTEKILPRWKRCVAATDAALGEALAQPFVRDTFGAEGKAANQSMVAEIERAMERDLEGLAWMDEPTRKKAFEKLHKINNKIGFPDAWRNYDTLDVTRASYAKNALRADAFEMRRVLGKIGKPLDRKEWYMTPPTVNAYYDANLNEMVFPAGILQPPFFDRKATMAMNYGAIGMVMGHELTHGFDDEGRQFDGDGNLKEWWSKAVSKKFDDKAACVVKQFDEYVAVEGDAPTKPGAPKEDVHVQGKLTLGENIADLGGLKLAYAAMQDALKGKPREAVSGFTEEQQFFISFAQGWCQNARPQYKRMLANVDPHSPPHYRVVGPASNLPEFAAAFSCKPGSKMVRKDRCEVW